MRILLVLVAIFAAQMSDPFAASAQPLPEKVPVAGRIVTPENTPVAGATVTIARQNRTDFASFWGDRVATNANGEFSFLDAEEGAYVITVTAPGFAPVTRSPLVVAAGVPATRLVLERMATLKLRVLKPDKSPAAKAAVAVRLQATLDDPPDGRRRKPSEWPTATDADGSLLLENIIPGGYTLHLVAPGLGVVMLSGLDLHYAVNPATVDVTLHSGGTVSVVAREMVAGKVARPLGGAIILMTPVPAVPHAPTAAAPVVAPAPAAAPNAATPAVNAVVWPEPAALMVQQSVLGTNGSVLTHEDSGSLQIADVPPGNYVVRLYSQVHKPVAAQTVEVRSAQTVNLEFNAEPIAPLASLEIEVHAGDKPVSDSEFQLQLRLPGTVGGGAAPASDIPVEVQRAFTAPVFLRRARTDKNGVLTVHGLLPGRWRVSIAPLGKVDGTLAGAYKSVNVPLSGGSITLTLPPATPVMP